MKYQYIYGRTETGYDVIQSSPNGYTGDSKVAKALNCSLEPPEDSEIPEPLIFINDVGGREISAVGRSRILPGIRESKLDHFYIFDGQDRQELYKNFEDIFSIKHFASSLEEAQAVNVNEQDIFGDIGLSLNTPEVGANMFKALIAAAFDAAASNAEIYIINKKSNRQTAFENESLVYALYSLLPWQLVGKLGFISYFKYISPSTGNTLSYNVKLRFVENNKANSEVISGKENEGHFVFNLADGYVSENARAKAPFLEALLSPSGKEKIESFYNALSGYVKDYSILRFDLVSALFNITQSEYENLPPEFEDIKILIREFKSLGDGMKQAFKNGLAGLRESLKHISDYEYNSFLIDIYNSSDELKNFVIEDFSARISQDNRLNAVETLKIMEYENIRRDFIQDLQKKLFSEPQYAEGGKLLIDASLRRLADNPSNKPTRIVKIAAQLEQIADISNRILDDIPESDYEAYIKETLLETEYAEFKNYVKKLQGLISAAVGGKQRLERIYVHTTLAYLRNYVNNQESIEDAIKAFFEVSGLIAPVKAVFTNKGYARYFEDVFNLTFTDKEPDKDSLKQLLLLCRLAEQLSKPYPESGFLFNISIRILNMMFKNEGRLEDESLEALSSWPDAYIKEIKSAKPPIARQIEDYKLRTELQSLIDKNSFGEIKEFLIENDEDSIKEVAIEWLDKRLISKSGNNKKDFDYKLLPYIFKDEPIKILQYLPVDSIGPWLECAGLAKAIRPRMLEIINSEPRLKRELSRLPAKKKAILGIRSKERYRTGILQPVVIIYIISSLILLIGIDIYNLFSSPKEAADTAVFGIITSALLAGLILAYDIYTKKESSLKALVAVLGAAALSVAVNAPIIALDAPNSENTYVKLYKSVYLIDNDIQPPVIEIAKITLNGEIIDSLSKTRTDDVLSIDLSISDNQPGTAVSAGIGGIPLTLTENSIELDMSHYAAGKHILAIEATDPFQNKTERAIEFYNEEAISIKATALITNSEQGYGFGKAIQEGNTISLLPSEMLTVKAHIVCADRTESVLIVNHEEISPSADAAYTLDPSKLLAGGNEAVITVWQTERAENEERFVFNIIKRAE